MWTGERQGGWLKDVQPVVPQPGQVSATPGAGVKNIGPQPPSLEILIQQVWTGVTANTPRSF